MSAPNAHDAADARDMSTRAGTPPTGAKRPRSFGEKSRQTFLAMLRDGWSVARAAKAVGFARTRLYTIRSQDEEFRAEWDDAVEAGLERLEDMAREAAEEGWWETVEDGAGNVKRRTHRRDPRLALRIRELRRPPEQTLNLRAAAEVTVSDPEVIERRVAALAEGRRLLAAGLLSAVGGLTDETRARVLAELAEGEVVDAEVSELPAASEEPS